MATSILLRIDSLFRSFLYFHISPDYILLASARTGFLNRLVLLGITP
nr:MAG TPA: hypothetical protein [Caudoviricetes sp.]